MKLVLFHQYDQLLAKIREVARCCAKDAADWKICRVQSSGGNVHLHDRTMNELSVSGGEYRVSEIDRIDIAADALDELKQPEYDGKTIVFTVRGNYSNAKIPATIRYVEPPPANPTLTKVHPSDEPENDGWMKPNPYENTVEGTNLATATKLEFKYMDGEDEYVDEFEIVSKTADSIVFKANAETMEDIGGHLIVTTPAGTCEGDFMATVTGS